MITVKGSVKYIRTAALLITAVLLFSGCSAITEDLPFIPLSQETEKISEYRVIISRGASGALIDRAVNFCSEINEKTGVEALLFYDDETLIYKEKTYEIVLGLTSRTVSRILLKGLRRDDYICAVEGARTVIGGRSDEATVAAVDRFCREILPTSTAERLLNEGGGFSFTGSYPVEKITLYGVELSEYSLEVPRSSDTEALNAAYSLRRLISEATGYVLSITVGTAAGRRISLRTAAIQMPEIAYIEKDEMGLTLTANEARGLKYSGEYLCTLLCKGGGGEASVPEKVSIPYGDGSIRIGSACFSSLLPFGNPQGVSIAAGVINGGTSEITLCGEMINGDISRLASAISGRTVLEESEIAAFLSDGQPSKVTLADISRSDGLTVGIFKIETPRLKLILTYVFGRAGNERKIALATEDGYASAALVHTQESEVTVTDADGNALTSTLKIGGVSCYADEAKLDVVAVNGGELYGEFEFFAR